MSTSTRAAAEPTALVTPQPVRSARARRVTIAGISAAVFAIIFAITNLTVAGQSAENAMLGGWFENQTLMWLPYHYLRLPPLLNEAPTIAVVVLLSAGIATMQQRWRDLALVLIATPAAIVGTKIFKDLVGRPALVEASSTDASYPSGHFAVAAALALALLAVVPRSWLRWCAVPLLAWVAAIGSGVQALGWHRPSDVVGGALFVVTVFLIVGAALSGRVERIDPRGLRPLLSGFVIWVVALAAAIVPATWPIAVMAVSSLVATAIVGWAALRAVRTGSGSGMLDPAHSVVTAA